MANFPKYVIKRSSNQQYYWVLLAVNANVLITSEMYTTKDACKDGIASSKRNVADSNFDKKMSSNGMQYYFTQRAGNNQVLGTSEMYNTSYARDNGIEAVKRDAPRAETEDQS